MHGINSKIVSNQAITKFIKQASDEVSNHKFTQNFLLAEWDQIVDTWQIETWDEYKNVARLGRKTRLPEVQREILWNIFEKVINKLQEEKLTTYSGLFNNLTKKLKASNKLPFDFAVIDESQDFNPSHLKFFHSLVSKNTNSLFFAGDLGQRIFQQPFSWLSLGIDIRGRSRTLRVNYRTSHQIRQQADRLLGPLTLDIDGNEEDRTDTISIFNGPPPDILKTKDQNEEIRLIGDWIKKHNVSNGVLPHEFGVFVRSKLQLERAEKAVIHSGLKYKILDDQVNTSSDFVSISTMHLAKGLEFKAVAVLACDDEVLPLQERIELITDDSDLQEVYDTERHLLYVACTRARDYLIISGVEPISEFLDDLKSFN
jgi:superfamily I DNA/RNA helicase